MDCLYLQKKSYALAKAVIPPTVPLTANAATERISKYLVALMEIWSRIYSLVPSW
jgi:hypothetical protein